MLIALRPLVCIAYALHFSGDLLWKLKMKIHAFWSQKKSITCSQKTSNAIYVEFFRKAATEEEERRRKVEEEAARLLAEEEAARKATVGEAEDDEEGAPETTEGQEEG